MLNDFFAQFKEVPKEEKKDFGQIINELKSKAEAKINELKEKLSGQNVTTQSLNDLTRPAFPIEIGSRHPVSLIKNRIIEVFANIGFNIAEGPEIEDDWHNFTALNLPEYHPARDMQDTFLYPDSSRYSPTYTYQFCGGSLHGTAPTSYSYHCSWQGVPQ